MPNPSNSPQGDFNPTNASFTSATLPSLNADSIDFSRGLKVVNRSTRFVLVVPELKDGGELLVYPEGDIRCGQAVKKNAENGPDRGILFFNGKDSAWQAARGNGKEVILINDVSQTQANWLLEKMRQLNGDNAATLSTLRTLLESARTELGCYDFYDKKLEGVAKDMSVVDEINPYFMRVTKDTIHSAVLIERGFTFDGPVPQVFPDGAVILNDGKHSWGIDKGVFQRNFRVVEGEKERALGDLHDEFRVL